MAGQRFGRLIAVKWTGRNRHGFSQWLCHCDCGNKPIITANKLRTANTKSCGCLKRDILRQPKTHGQTKTLTHMVWVTMRQRCENPRNKKYARYGGRGIRICDRWQKFENFFKDMGEKPIGKTIERTNNDGNYEPGNCCWATPKQQANNTIRNRRITFGGRSLTLTEWSKEMGVNPSSLFERVEKWGIERALTEQRRK